MGQGRRVSKRRLLGLARVSSPFGRSWVKVRKLESHNRKPDPFSFAYWKSDRPFRIGQIIVSVGKARRPGFLS